MTDPEFLALRDALLAESGIPTVYSVGTFLERWEAFVTECEQGYAFCWAEWLNDAAAARRPIDVVFGDPVLGADWRVTQFADRLASADARLRCLFVPDVSSDRDDPRWWKRGVLRLAGREYADDVLGMFGISVDVVG